MESQSRCLSVSLTPAEAELLQGVLRFIRDLAGETLSRRGEMEKLLAKLGGAVREKSFPYSPVRQALPEEKSTSDFKQVLFSKEELQAIL